MLLSVLLVIAGCDGVLLDTAPPPLDDSGADTGAPDDGSYDTWTGEARWAWAWDTDPDAVACDLAWTTQGTPIDACEDCLWAFDIAFQYDAASSVDRGDCTEGLSVLDFQWRMGLVLDWYGYGVPVLHYQDDEYGGWYPLFAASWQSPDLSWGGGYDAYPYTYGEQTWYYTAYWTGQAQVQ